MAEAPEKKEGPEEEKGKSKSEKFLLTRKTWRFMADAGRNLLPEGLTDLKEIEKNFQEVCTSEKAFLLRQRVCSDSDIQPSFTYMEAPEGDDPNRSHYAHPTMAGGGHSYDESGKQIMYPDEMRAARAARRPPGYQPQRTPMHSTSLPSIPPYSKHMSGRSLQSPRQDPKYPLGNFPTLYPKNVAPPSSPYRPQKSATTEFHSKPFDYNQLRMPDDYPTIGHYEPLFVSTAVEEEEVEVKVETADAECNTDPIEEEPERKSKKSAEAAAARQKRNSETLSESTLASVNRYLNMMRRKSKVDSKQEFKKINYDKSLRNIKSKRCDDICMDEGNSKGIQVEQMLLPALQLFEPRKPSETASSEKSTSESRTMSPTSPPISPKSTTTGSEDGGLKRSLLSPRSSIDSSMCDDDVFQSPTSPPPPLPSSVVAGGIPYVQYINPTTGAIQKVPAYSVSCIPGSGAYPMMPAHPRVMPPRPSTAPPSLSAQQAQRPFPTQINSQGGLYAPITEQTKLRPSGGSSASLLNVSQASKMPPVPTQGQLPSPTTTSSPTVMQTLTNMFSSAVIGRSRGSPFQGASRLAGKKIWRNRSKSQSRATASSTCTWNPQVS